MGQTVTNCVIQVTVSSTATSGSNQLVGLATPIIVTGPTQTGKATTPYTSITQIDDQMWRMVSKDYSSRFILGGGQCGEVNSNVTVPADLALRTINNYLWLGKQNVLSIETIAPVTFPLVPSSPQYGTLTWETISNLVTGSGMIAQFTTTAPSRPATGNILTFPGSWPTASTLPVIDHTCTPAWQLAGDIGSSDTTLTITPSTNLSNFHYLQIDGEQIANFVLGRRRRDH